MSRLNAKRQEKTVVVKSLWPLSIRRVFLSLNEVPWVSFTALSTAWGGALLFIYFHSIGYVPSDLSALFGLGVTTAVMSIGLLAFFAFSLFSPTWIYQIGLADLKPAFQSINRKHLAIALAGLQFGCLGGFLLHFAYQQFNCNNLDVFWVVVGGLLSIWGLSSLAYVIFIPADLKKRIWCGFCAILIGGCGTVSIVVLRPLQLALAPTGFLADLIFFGLFAVIVFFNAIAALALVRMKVAVFSLFVTVYLLLILPLWGSNPVFFPTIVAGVLGVRESKPQELHIPQKTCQLLLSVVDPNSSLPLALKCPAGDWGVVTAQVLSNVGDRWLVQVARQKDKAAAIDEEEALQLRITIPKEGVQIITQTEHSADVKQDASTCKKTQSI